MIRDSAESVCPGPESPSTPPQCVAGVSVLLAEDGIDNQQLIQLLLHHAGATVELAENGRIAVEKALSHSFDVVLMDIQMPEMDGYQATRTLRQQGFQKPIVALTAHAMAGDREQCLLAGCNDHLTKPIDRAPDRENCAVRRQRERSRLRRLGTAPPTDVGSESRGGARTLRSGGYDQPSPTTNRRPSFSTNISADFPGTSKACGQALASGRHDALQELAHQMKGAGGSYGYPQLSEAAAKLEHAARVRDGVAAGPAFEIVVEVWRRIEKGRDHASAGGHRFHEDSSEDRTAPRPRRRQRRCAQRQVQGRPTPKMFSLGKCRFNRRTVLCTRPNRPVATE